MLHHFDRAIVMACIDVELRGFGRAPVAAVGIGGRLQFTHGKINQPAIAEQLRFLQVNIFRRRFRQSYLVAMLQRRDVVEQRIFVRRICCRRKFLQTLTA